MPVYNEVATLAAAVERVMSTELPIPIELIVVDDGSTDGSRDVLRDLSASHDLKVLQHAKNRGKGAAIRTALAEASGDVFTVMDADLECDPSDYRHLLEPILSGQASVTYGTRFFGPHNAYSFWYVIGHKFLALWTSLLFNTWLSDVYTCFKMAETEAWRSLDLRSDGFEIEAEVTAKFLRSHRRIHEVPIDYWPRTRTDGKKIRWTDGLLALFVLTRVRFLGR